MRRLLSRSEILRSSFFVSYTVRRSDLLLKQTIARSKTLLKGIKPNVFFTEEIRTCCIDQSDLLLKQAITRRKSLWEGVKVKIVYTIGSGKSAIRGSIKISNNRNFSFDTVIMNLGRSTKILPKIKS